MINENQGYQTDVIDVYPNSTSNAQNNNWETGQQINFGYDQPQVAQGNSYTQSTTGSTAALVLGIVGLVCCTPCGIAALILGIVGLVNGKEKRSFYLAGTVLGAIATILTIIGTIVGLVYGAAILDTGLSTL